MFDTPRTGSNDPSAHDLAVTEWLAACPVLPGGITGTSLVGTAGMDALSLVSKARRALDSFEGRVLASLERSQVIQDETGHTTARWLSNETGLPHAVAKGRVNVARQLHDHFDGVQTALDEGRISHAHAQAIINAANPRILHQLVGIQDQLAKMAEAADRFEWFHRELESIVNLLDQDGSFDPNGETQRNRLAFRFDTDGVRIDGKLVGASAATVTETLNRIADELFKRRCPDEPSFSRPQLLAEALIELCRRGRANGTSGRIPQADITLVVNANDPSTAITPDGQTIDGDSLKRACCDADITAVTVDGDGQPLNVGRTRRLATDAQRRAAMVRDGGCVFPGCGLPVNWCDLHHVVEWQSGGSTDINNLVCLCRRHHGITHSQGWHMEATGPPGHFQWTTPTGKTLPSERRRATPKIVLRSQTRHRGLS